jgi:hypothetical protein
MPFLGLGFFTASNRRVRHPGIQGCSFGRCSEEGHRHRICLLHTGLTMEALRQKLIADGEAMGEAETGTERAFHITHESVGDMFPGKMEPV